MEQNENDPARYREMSSRIWSGVILVAAGGLLLGYKMGFPIPGWIFTWPVLLISLGLIAGIKSRFHNPGAMIMIVVGSVFLIDKTRPELNFHNYIIPAILIGVGLIFILKPRHHWGAMSRRKFRRMRYGDPVAGDPVRPAPLNYVAANNDTQGENAEYVDINTAFGSVKKIILSKNFKGGEINNFMGGTELNLMKADIQQPIGLEVNNVFGGTKLIIPSNWDIKNEVTAVFGGIEDKRSVNTGVTDAGKVMVLKGACVFGGIEITNY